MRLKKGEGVACNAIVPSKKAIHQDRMEHAQQLAQRHMQLQARQLAAELAVELRCRAKVVASESQELEKQCRLDVKDVISEEEKERRLQERHEHEVRTQARAHYLEWATAAERLHHQDTLAQRRHEMSLVREAERNQLLDLRRQNEIAVVQRQRAHELALSRVREQKAAQYDAKIDRIKAMEVRREEMLEDMTRMRQSAYTKFEDLKALAYESAVENNDDALRRILEELVPSLLGSIPHTKRGSFHRATSAGPCLLEPPHSFSGLDSPYSSPKSPRETTRTRSPGGRRARSLESPRWSPGCGRKVGFESPRRSMCCPVDLRLMGIGSGVRRPLSPGSTRKRQTEPGSTRSTSAASLGNSGLFSSSHGSASWESISLPSPVGPQVSQLLANARNQPLAASGVVASNPAAPIDCPLCYTTPRHPRRGIDIATYAKFARGMPCRPLETSEQTIGT